MIADRVGCSHRTMACGGLDEGVVGERAARSLLFPLCPGIDTELAHSSLDLPSPRTGVGQKGRLHPHEAPFPFPHPPLRASQYPARCPRPNKRHVGQLVAEAKARSPTDPIDFTAAGGTIVSGQRWLRISTSAPRSTPTHGQARALPTSPRLAEGVPDIFALWQD